MSAMVELRGEVLTAADRCDRCGAAAACAVQLADAPAMLLLCGHHVRRHQSALQSQPRAIIFAANGNVVLSDGKVLLP